MRPEPDMRGLSHESWMNSNPSRPKTGLLGAPARAQQGIRANQRWCADRLTGCEAAIALLLIFQHCGELVEADGVLAVRAGGDHADHRARFLLHEAEVFLCLL